MKRLGYTPEQQSHCKPGKRVATVQTASTHAWMPMRVASVTV
jgi:hypothetical protein